MAAAGIRVVRGTAETAKTAEFLVFTVSNTRRSYDWLRGAENPPVPAAIALSLAWCASAADRHSRSRLQRARRKLGFWRAPPARAAVPRLTRSAPAAIRTARGLSAAGLRESCSRPFAARRPEAPRPARQEESGPCRPQFHERCLRLFMRLLPDAARRCTLNPPHGAGSGHPEGSAFSRAKRARPRPPAFPRSAPFRIQSAA